MARAARPEAWHSWVPLVIPADARTIRAEDPALRDTLHAAGAVDAEASPDIEAGAPRSLRGDARCACVRIESPVSHADSRAVRGAARLGRSAAVKLRAAAARRAVARAYDRVDVLTWEPSIPVRLAGAPDLRVPLRERFPLHAVVVGRRDDSPTIVEAVLAEVGETEPPARLTVRGKGGAALVFARPGLVRVAVGPVAAKLSSQQALLADLERAAPPELSERVPWPLASGRTGLGEWTLERRLPGRRPRQALPPRAQRECVDFLVALFTIDGALSPSSSLLDHAAALAAAAPEASGKSLTALAERADELLADVPRGYAHGDFGLPNLLLDGDRLAGVVDWEAAGGGRLPLLDLLHLLASPELGDVGHIGPAVADVLLPRVRSRSDPAIAEYCERSGLDLSSEQLDAIVVAYWLEMIAFAVLAYPRSGAWLQQNVARPLRSLLAERVLVAP